MSSLHRVSHSESSLFKNLSLKFFLKSNMFTILESTYTAISFPPCSWTLSSLKNIVYPSHRERPDHQQSSIKYKTAEKSQIRLSLFRHLALSFVLVDTAVRPVAGRWEVNVECKCTVKWRQMWKPRKLRSSSSIVISQPYVNLLVSDALQPRYFEKGAKVRKYFYSHIAAN